MSSKKIAWLVVLLITAGTGLTAARQLDDEIPYAAHVDEPAFVIPTLTMLLKGSADPRWYDHPGSTVIYPLYGLYKIWFWVADVEAGFHRSPGWQEKSASTQALEIATAHLPTVIMTGRYLMLFFALVCIPFIFLIARTMTASTAVGIAAAGLFSFFLVANIVELIHIRTDTATLLAVCLCLYFTWQARQRRRPQDDFFAGLAYGFAIATKFYLGLWPLLFGAMLTFDLLKTRASIPVYLRRAASAGGGCFLSFLILSPFTLVHFAKASKFLAGQINGKGHAAGMSSTYWENLLRYVFEFSPQVFSYGGSCAFLSGAALIIYLRKTPYVVLPLYAALHILAISASQLYWSRWLFPLMPVAALLVAMNGTLLPEALSRYPKLLAGRYWQPVLGVFLAGLLGASWWTAWSKAPAPRTTRAATTAWLVENVPDGSVISADLYAQTLAPFHSKAKGLRISTHGKEFLVFEKFFLGAAPVKTLVCAGVDFVVTNRDMQRRARTSAHGSSTVRLYRELNLRFAPIATIGPDRSMSGPTIDIYKFSRYEFDCSDVKDAELAFDAFPAYALPPQRQALL